MDDKFTKLFFLSGVLPLHHRRMKRHRALPRIWEPCSPLLGCSIAIMANHIQLSLIQKDDCTPIFRTNFLGFTFPICQRTYAYLLAMTLLRLLYIIMTISRNEWGTQWTRSTDLCKPPCSTLPTELRCHVHSYPHEPECSNTYLLNFIF